MEGMMRTGLMPPSESESESEESEEEEDPEEEEDELVSFFSTCKDSA
jgi:hypothetical protein